MDTKRKLIPVIIILLAAAIASLTSVIQRVSFDIFTKRLFFAVVCFAVIGCIVRVVIERSFKIMEPEEETEETVEDGEGENFSLDEEKEEQS